MLYFCLFVCFFADFVLLLLSCCFYFIFCYNDTYYDNTIAFVNVKHHGNNNFTNLSSFFIYFLPSSLLLNYFLCSLQLIFTKELFLVLTSAYIHKGLNLFWGLQVARGPECGMCR